MPSRMSSPTSANLLLAHALGVFRHHAGQRLAEAGEVRAAIALRDVVGEAQHGLVEAVVPRQCELDADAVRAFGGGDGDRGREHRDLGAVQPFDERDQPAVVAERDFLRRRVALIAQHDGKPGVEEGKLAQAAFQHREVELGAREGRGARLEDHLGAARPRGRPDHLERRLGVAVAETDEVLQPVAPDPHLHPFRQRVHHRRADAVQAAGNLVGRLIELAARVQARQHHLGRRDAFLGVDVGGDAAAVVTHRHAAVAVQRQLDAGGVPRLRLIDGVVDDLEGHVV